MKLLSAFVHDIVIDSKKSDLLAAVVGKSRNLLLNELNPETLSNKAGMDLLIPIMEKCDPQDKIMHELADVRGGVFMRLPVIESADGARREFMEAMSEIGALARSYEHAKDKYGPGGSEVKVSELEMFERQAQLAMSALQRAVFACRVELKQSREE